MLLFNREIYGNFSSISPYNGSKIYLRFYSFLSFTSLPPLVNFISPSSIVHISRFYTSLPLFPTTTTISSLVSFASSRHFQIYNLVSITFIHHCLMYLLSFIILLLVYSPFNSNTLTIFQWIIYTCIYFILFFSFTTC